MVFRLGCVATAPVVGALAYRNGLTTMLLVLLAGLLILLLPTALAFLASLRPVVETAVLRENSHV
jgi:hypothetical protein